LAACMTGFGDEAGPMERRASGCDPPNLIAKLAEAFGTSVSGDFSEWPQ
jgi:hypothetical protein